MLYDLDASKNIVNKYDFAMGLTSWLEKIILRKMFIEIQLELKVFDLIFEIG